MKNKILKYGTAAFLWMVYVFPAMAEDQHPQYPDSSDDLPIDQWQFILFLAAAAIGFYFLRQKQIHTQKQNL